VSNARDSVPGQQPVRCLALAPESRTLATGQADSTILLWDLSLRDNVQKGASAQHTMDSLWEDLAGANALRGYTAVWHLVDDPQHAVPFLKTHLRPVVPAAAEEVRSLLHDLDSNQFKIRNAAVEKLRSLGERAEPALREALQENMSLEKRQRLEALLSRFVPFSPLQGATLRGVRAVQVLERIGTSEAREILERLAHGMASASLSRAAQGALERMTNC
jgi:hypothetical protein